mmetsp:Transcript_9241/g.24237  ORF Transcript_9241/g.24237 Transcript_9241/m.24237 type:complete len:312 (-) Transcript_9241:747-1682(-)
MIEILPHSHKRHHRARVCLVRHFVRHSPHKLYLPEHTRPVETHQQYPRQYLQDCNALTGSRCCRYPLPLELPVRHCTDLYHRVRFGTRRLRWTHARHFGTVRRPRIHHRAVLDSHLELVVQYTDHDHMLIRSDNDRFQTVVAPRSHFLHRNSRRCYAFVRYIGFHRTPLIPFHRTLLIRFLHTLLFPFHRMLTGLHPQVRRTPPLQVPHTPLCHAHRTPPLRFLHTPKLRFHRFHRKQQPLRFLRAPPLQVLRRPLLRFHRMQLRQFRHTELVPFRSMPPLRFRHMRLLHSHHKPLLRFRRKPLHRCRRRS